MLLAGPRGRAWRDAATGAARGARPPLVAYTVGADLEDADGTWQTVYEVDEDGAVLVRPDGHVAWRSRGAAEDAPRTLDAAMDSILRGAPPAEVSRPRSVVGA